MKRRLTLRGSCRKPSVNMFITVILFVGLPVLTLLVLHRKKQEVGLNSFRSNNEGVQANLLFFLCNTKTGSLSLTGIWVDLCYLNYSIDLFAEVDKHHLLAILFRSECIKTRECFPLLAISWISNWMTDIRSPGNIFEHKSCHVEDKFERICRTNPYSDIIILSSYICESAKIWFGSTFSKHFS